MILIYISHATRGAWDGLSPCLVVRHEGPKEMEMKGGYGYVPLSSADDDDDAMCGITIFYQIL